MPPTYNVYLSKSSSDPDSGTEGTNYLHFVCKLVSPSMSNKNIREHLPEHKSIKINLGDFIIKCTLQECIFKDLTSLSGWNKFMEFVGDHLMSGGDTIYLWVYDAFGAAGYFKWFNDSGIMKNYMKCTIIGFRFSFDAIERTIKGTMQLEEVWA